jgi:broad specificity phosphatase PhoE
VRENKRTLSLDYLLAVRHGQTEANEKGIEAGPLDYPLSRNGRKEVRHISRKLAGVRIQAVYSSPILRAVQTAEILAKPHKLKVKTLEELTEAKIKPRFVGKKGRHHIRESPEDYLETYDELRRRITKAIDTIKAQERGNVIVVSHGDVITAMLEEVVERREDSSYYVMHAEPASLSIIEMKSRPFLTEYNYRWKMLSGL